MQKIEIGNLTILTSVPPGGGGHGFKATTSVPPDPNLGGLTAATSVPPRLAATSVPPRAGVETSVPPDGGQLTALAAEIQCVDTSIPPIGISIAEPMKLVKVRLQTRGGRLFVYLDGEKIG